MAKLNPKRAERNRKITVPAIPEVGVNPHKTSFTPGAVKLSKHRDNKQHGGIEHEVLTVNHTDGLKNILLNLTPHWDNEEFQLRYTVKDRGVERTFRITLTEVI